MITIELLVILGEGLFLVLASDTLIWITKLHCVMGDLIPLCNNIS